MSTRTNKKTVDHEKLEATFYDMALKKGLYVPLNPRTVKYKNYMIIKGPDDRWNVFLMPKKIFISSTFLKVSAFAIAKFHELRRTHRIQEAEREDAVFQKNYIDSVFYRNTIIKSKDPVLKDTALWRLELVKVKAKNSKARIDNIFYSLIT
jgi:hypothetical protein